MNSRLKNNIRDITDLIGHFVKNLVDTLVSCMRILILSSFSDAIRTKSIRGKKRYENCTILANGPSLKKAIEENEVIIKDVDVFCVNSFCESEYFWKIKPRFYLLVDSQFFCPTLERCKIQVKNIKDAFAKIDWEMTLYVSSSSDKGGVLDGLSNPNINVIRLNTTTTEGYKCFRHFIYNIHLGMPRCQTVINMALTTSIIMGYKNVYLYGADHSWIKDIRVDDANVCYYGDRHVYNTKLVEIKKQEKIGELLFKFAQMFNSHCIIETFAHSRNICIWNCTKDSFVDAYKRFKH